jgi:hypothetical protein
MRKPIDLHLTFTAISALDVAQPEACGLMTEDEQIFRQGLSRRGFLATAGVAGAGIAIAPLLGAGAHADPAPVSSVAGAAESTPRVGGLHLQFGSDACTEAVVSWHTLQPVHQARVLLGDRGGRFERMWLRASDATSTPNPGQTVYAQHAHLEGRCWGWRRPCPCLYSQGRRPGLSR